MLPDFSIIIPAFNERRFIERQVGLLKAMTGDFSAEIIVVDNGSTDGTPDLARRAGATAVLEARGSVAAVRNAGAQSSMGAVLIFLDADVFPTEEWRRRLPEVLANIRREARLVTGSWVAVPDECSWLERTWFRPLEHGGNSHINSGHMIIARSFFDELGGFDASLRTGEDFDISMRAKARAGRVHDDPMLRVIHEGYPKTLWAFMRREMWHGTGDYRSLSTWLGSKVAMASAVLFHGLVLGALAAIVTGSAAWFAVPLSAAVGFSAAAAFVRYAHAPVSTRLANTLVYFAYFLSRGLSPYANMRRSRAG